MILTLEIDVSVPRHFLAGIVNFQIYNHRKKEKLPNQKIYKVYKDAPLGMSGQTNFIEYHFDLFERRPTEVPINYNRVSGGLS